MSYSELNTVDTRGRITVYAEYRNSHGFCPLIWEALTDKYFPLAPGEQTWQRKIGMLANMQPIWDLQKREDVPQHEKIVLLSTFDRAACQFEGLITMADAYEKFQAELGIRYPERVNHLSKMAEDYRKIAEMSKIKAVCWYGTSVGENLWRVYPNGGGDSRPYNFVYSKPKRHWYIFNK